MTADLETLVVAAYYFAALLPVPRRGRPARVSDAELVALAVGQAVMGICSDRQFLGLVGKVLPGFFPRLPSQSQYNRRLRALTPQLVWVQRRLSELLATRLAQAGRRHPGRGRQLRRLRAAQRLRRPGRLRLLPLQEPLLLGDATRAARRPQRAAGRIHARPREREGVRAGA